jgi:YD repeat-containing protein
MKRLFTYILALSLLPQIASAAVVVGKTEGTFAVSVKGAATYTIPLTIQKGMSDFKPELSLVYDSQDGNGIMGLGWSIKGMHTISTVSKCQYFDGTNQGTAYALDGMRLIETTSPNGQLYYRTEHDKGDSISIKQNGLNNWFQVKSIDGSTYRYGSSTGRYINGDNCKWALDYAQDALGNYISYTYDQNGGLYPTSITYGRNVHGTAGVNCVISFTYDSSMPKRLTKIECKYNGSVYRSYTFNYVTDTPSRLISITEGGRNSATFAPTTFGWELPDEPYDDYSPRINTISNGLGATESLSYGEECWHPVVISRTESIPTESKTTSYYYSDCFCDAYDELRGFLYIEETSSTGIVTERYWKKDKNLRAYFPYKVVKRNTDEEAIQIDYDETVVESAGGRAYRTYAKAYTTNKPFDNFIESFDHWYSPDWEEIHSRDAVYESWGDIIPWESPIDTIRIKKLPSKIGLLKMGDYSGVNGVKYETTTYERDPYTGLVLKETKKRGTDEEDQVIVSTDGYSYNIYGQVTSHWTVAYNSTDTLVTTYQYNTKGQLYKEYNPLGQYKTYSYNTYTGALASIVEFDGSTTSYSYDNMLRKTGCSGSSKVVTTTWSTANYGGSVYSVKVTETDKSPITTYYDAWNRKVAESTTLAATSSKTTYTDYQYYPNGSVHYVSFPHLKSESAGGTTYYYDDPAYRLTKTEDTNGKISTWEYDNAGFLCVTSCVDGITTNTTYYRPDMLFRITAVDDMDGVEFCYNEDSNYESVINYFGELYVNYDSHDDNFERDIYGRVVRSIDRNGVIKEYTYDVNGYPSETRIGSSYVRTNYDKFGRLMRKMWYEPGEDSLTVTYTYNTDVKKKHLVAQEQGNNYTYTYTYNNYGKLTGKHHSVSDGAQTQYANIGIQYNSDKQISKKTCTFGLASNKNFEEEFIYKNGCLNSDSLNHQLIMRVNRQDNWGNVTRETTSLAFGGASWTFDDYGHMLTMSHSRVGDETYAYDIETGNMIEKDSIPYTYDDMNRLIGWGDYTYSYDLSGNITSQPLIGDFTYDAYKLNDMAEASGFHADDSLSISYYKALGRPKCIKNENYKAEFSYDGNGNRILMKVYKKVSGQYMPYLTRYYLGEEAEVNIDSLGKRKGYYYAGNDAQTAPAVMEVQPGGSASIWKIVRDNVGSVFGYNRSTLHYKFSYNPWGVRTQLDDVTDFQMPGESLGDCPFYRTYRGYEDLWMFGLLFDKTRLYNPYQGRYLSPETVVNTVDRCYNRNPYIFSKNNPFRVVK